MDLTFCLLERFFFKKKTTFLEKLTFKKKNPDKMFYEEFSLVVEKPDLHFFLEELHLRLSMLFSSMIVNIDYLLD